MKFSATPAYETLVADQFRLRQDARQAPKAVCPLLTKEDWSDVGREIDGFMRSFRANRPTFTE